MTHGRRVGLALDTQLLFKHHTEVFAGAQQFADEAGWTTVIDNWPEETLSRGNRGKPAYDGIIARVTLERSPLLDLARAASVPVVNVLCGSPAFESLPGVFPDYASVGRLQGEHLLGQGVRNFAFIGIKDRRHSAIQFDGFKAAVGSAGHAVSECALPYSWDDDRELFRQTRTRILAWMNTWKTPVGVASSHDDFVRFVAQLCLDRGWRVPKDVFLIGNANEEHHCEKPRPALSSVEIGFDRVGYEAARLLESLMSHPKPRRGGGRTGARLRDQPRPEHVLLPPVGIVARESTDSFATNDPIVAEAQAFIAEHCHTPIDDQGQPKPGMDFAGGMEFVESGYLVRSANITPDADTGIGSWSEQQFIDKFKAFENTPAASLSEAERRQNTVMPMTAYAGMAREDLAAIYAYLRTLKPVINRVERFPAAN